ncbi:MAG TPA: OmpH family outer membrane protein [Niabella sp.]|nr:OmpH family outer membrane protein [Niabella sp.]HOZ96267.1 OmpH family outer membrane protein [Niabella sp.]HQW14659.1 OmpH family outer membrane protein [Niabella sp.]HQX19798.1 OmpH family outer membrane protein [Niabella sp.]HQX41102.1 OmpH family outer membrane protein [Niabella sp.]
MKQSLLVVNTVLVIAVSYLLYKQFSLESGGNARAADTLVGKDSSAHSKKILIAYINMDSIENGYKLAKEVTNEVERRREAISKEMEKMEANYKGKMEGYQKKGATMTEEEVNAARQDLDNSMRQMSERRQNLDEEFGQWVRSKNLSVMKDIQDYLKKFNADGTYSFIFSYEPGFFYYKDTTFDITQTVLKGLNNQFKTTKK